MVLIWYNRFKIWIWLIVTLLFAFGVVSKAARGLEGQTALNAVGGVIALIIWITLVIRRRAAQNEQQAAENKMARLVILFTITGAFASAAMIPYQLQAGLAETLQSSGSTLSVTAVSFLSIGQTAVQCLIMSMIGLALARKVGLGAPKLAAWAYKGQTPKLSLKWVAICIAGSLIGTVMITLLDTKVFIPRLTALQPVPDFDVWRSALVIFYGGIVEEVLLRLFLMTAVVWLLSIPFRRQNLPVPASKYWMAILFSAVLFGLAHLPATQVIFGTMNGLLFFRAIVLNGLLGVFFGYLYWRKGLEYAIVAHMAADVLLHVALPAIMG